MYDEAEQYQNSIKTDYKYSNSKVYDCDISSTMKLSIGVEATNDIQGLYINPKFEFGLNDQDRYGFYIVPEKHYLEFSDENIEDYTTPNHENIQFFALRGRTYDKVSSAEYNSPSDYGVRWKYNPYSGYDKEDGDTIHIRIVCLDTGVQYGVAAIEIKYNASRGFYINKVYNTNERYSDTFTKEEIDGFINAAIKFFRNGTESFQLGFEVDLFDELVDMATVEFVNKPYFTYLYNNQGEMVNSVAFTTYDLVAVSLPFQNYGVFTAYFAPEPQTYGIQLQSMEEDGHIIWILVGYDAFRPLNEEVFSTYVADRDLERMLNGYIERPAPSESIFSDDTSDVDAAEEEFWNNLISEAN